LRQRLDQAQGLVNEARSAAAALLDAPLDEAARAAGDHDLALDAALRPVAGGPAPERAPRPPRAPARPPPRRGRDLLGQLRGLGDAFAPAEAGGPAPLGHHYRDTVAMIDTALRTVALLPDSTAAQMQLCRGLEVTLEDVAGRLRTLMAGGRR